MSVKELLQPTQNYKATEELVTPYLRAKEEWDNRIGSSRVQAANWRFCALGLIVLCIILTFGLIYQSTKSKITPYIVQVEANGAATAIGPAKVEYIPQDKEIKYFLSQIIQKSRTIPLDPVVAKQNWLSVYAFLRPSAALKMNERVKDENPFGKIGDETISVDVNVIVPMSDNTYQIRWTETVYTKEGSQKETYKMTGLFTIDFTTPTDEKSLYTNPLGLFVKDFSWSKEL